MARKKAEAKPLLSDMEVMGGELAQIIGKTPRWIRQLTTDNVLTQVSRGKYILGEAIQAYVEHAAGGKEDSKPRYIDHKTEHERIKTERAALQLSQLRGELHSAEDVEAVMSDMITAFRQKILSIPTKLSPQIAGIDDINIIKAQLTKDLHEALAELADYDPELFREGAEAGVDIDGQT